MLLSAQSICGVGACVPVKGFIFQLEKRRRQMFVICLGSARAALAYFGAGNRQDLRKLHSGGGGLDSPWPPVPLLLSSRSPTTLHYMHVTFVGCARLIFFFLSLSLSMLIISLPPLQRSVFTRVCPLTLNLTNEAQVRQAQTLLKFKCEYTLKYAKNETTRAKNSTYFASKK